MATSAVTSTGSTATTSAMSKGLASMQSKDFLNILIKQLQMQDPLEPMGNAEMVNQLSTISELEMNTRLTDSLGQMTDQQRFGAAAVLIGKHVTGTVTDGNDNAFPMEGVVTGIRFTETGDVMLELDSGETLPLVNLKTVTNPATGATTVVDATDTTANSTDTADSTDTTDTADAES